eukprot:2048948-Pyramimonas_sp.AAC.1
MSDGRSPSEAQSGPAEVLGRHGGRADQRRPIRRAAAGVHDPPCTNSARAHRHTWATGEGGEEEAEEDKEGGQGKGKARTTN